MIDIIHHLEKRKSIRLAFIRVQSAWKSKIPPSESKRNQGDVEVVGGEAFATTRNKKTPGDLNRV
jgi:hypothetical protein